MAEGRGLEPRTRITPGERLAIFSNTIMGAFLNLIWDTVLFCCLRASGKRSIISNRSSPLFSFGGPDGIRTRSCAVTGRYTRLYTMEPKFGCCLPAAVTIADQVYYITCIRVYTPSASVNQPSRPPSIRFSTREDYPIAKAG